VKLEIRFGGYQEPASIHNRAAAHFGERLTRALGERVGFELIGSILKLGRPSGDLVPMVERGELSFCYMSTVRFSRAAPDLQLLELPFLVKDRGTVFRALDGESGERAAGHVAARTPCRLLGYWDNGFRHLSNRLRPIRRPDDCRGIRIRTQMSDLHGEVFRALGFEPIASDVKEFVEQIGGDRTLSGHFWGASALVCNAGHYQSWPAEVRAAVDVAARAATAYQRQLAAAEDEEIMAKLDPATNDVIRLTDGEREAFIRAVQPVVEKYRTQLDARLFAYLEA
jgi:TRAP-type C4-dicarboxylate transport system substrate-binding protein